MFGRLGSPRASVISSSSVTISVSAASELSASPTGRSSIGSVSPTGRRSHASPTGRCSLASDSRPSTRASDSSPTGRCSLASDNLVNNNNLVVVGRDGRKSPGGSSVGGASSTGSCSGNDGSGKDDGEGGERGIKKEESNPWVCPDDRNLALRAK